MSIQTELHHSLTLLLLHKKLNYLLFLAPIALVGQWGNNLILGESSCFVLAGLALIPLAEVSF